MESHRDGYFEFTDKQAALLENWVGHSSEAVKSILASEWNLSFFHLIWLA
jgi:hypothetical protein